MTKNFNPPLEGDEGKIGPGDGNQTEEQESDNPTVVGKNFRKKKSPKRVLALPDLEQAKSAVLNTLTS